MYAVKDKTKGAFKLIDKFRQLSSCSVLHYSVYSSKVLNGEIFVSINKRARRE